MGRNSPVNCGYCVWETYSENQGLDINQIYPKVLEKELGAKYPGKTFSVVNAGMAGWRLWEFYGFLEDMVPVIKPDVVIIGLGASAASFVSAKRPAVSSKKIFAGLPVKADRTMLDQAQWYIWFINQYLETVSQAYIFLRKITYYPFLWCNLEKIPVFHPLCTDPSYCKKALEPTRMIVQQIQQLCKKNGIRLGIMHVPYYYECIPPATAFKIQIEKPDVATLDVKRPARFMKAIAQDLEIPLYDPSDDLAAVPEPVYFPVFLHWNERGNRIAADGLLRFMEEKQLLNPSP